MYSVGKKIGPYTVVKQLWDQNAYYCTNEEKGGFVFAVTHETLADLEKTQQGEKMADNVKVAYNTSSYDANFGYQLGMSNSFNINNTQTPKPMTRLTTSGDWTILLEEGKLVAVDSNGRTIRAVGSLLSADGKAWMWYGGKLWSGALELTDTEAGVREKERLNKIHELRLKEQKLNEKQDNAIRAINIKFDKLRENL